jgi:5-methylcytosine-specific restriction enzyme subunit McrC
MPFLTVFEHETLPFDWDDRDLAALEKLNRAAGSELLRASTRGGQRVLRASQHVGVIRLGRQSIQVLPKIYYSPESQLDDKARARQATQNLLYLLAYAGQIPMHEQALAGLLKRDLDWFEILTRLFVSHLESEWQAGAHRSYQTVDNELPLLKGRWRLAEQIRRPERRHVFDLTFDEFTADNPLNRTFRYVVERLWRLTRNPDNQRRLGVLRLWLEGVNLLPQLTLADTLQIPITRLNQRFEPLLNLARLFVDDASLQLAHGEHTAFSFVFDMNTLYESFVTNLIRKHRQEILPTALQNCDLLPQTRGAALSLAQRAGREVFLLKPDLAFRSAGRFPLLVDMKYKRLDPADRRLGVSQGDFYQMYAYARRYCCPRVILLYPQTAEMSQPLQAYFCLNNEVAQILVATLDIRLDLSRPDERKNLIRRLKTILEMNNEPI